MEEQKALPPQAFETRLSKLNTAFEKICMTPADTKRAGKLALLINDLEQLRQSVPKEPGAQKKYDTLMQRAENLFAALQKRKIKSLEDISSFSLENEAELIRTFTVDGKSDVWETLKAFERAVPVLLPEEIAAFEGYPDAYFRPLQLLMLFEKHPELLPPDLLPFESSKVFHRLCALEARIAAYQGDTEDERQQKRMEEFQHKANNPTYLEPIDNLWIGKSLLSKSDASAQLNGMKHLKAAADQSQNSRVSEAAKKIIQAHAVEIASKLEQCRAQFKVLAEDKRSRINGLNDLLSTTAHLRYKVSMLVSDGFAEYTKESEALRGLVGEIRALLRKQITHELELCSEKLEAKEGNTVATLNLIIIELHRLRLAIHQLGDGETEEEGITNKQAGVANAFMERAKTRLDEVLTKKQQEAKAAVPRAEEAIVPEVKAAPPIPSAAPLYSQLAPSQEAPQPEKKKEEKEKVSNLITPPVQVSRGWFGSQPKMPKGGMVGSMNRGVPPRSFEFEL